MAHLSQIKNRIFTIHKTQKITKSMRLIAMSFYSKLERQRSMLNAYRQSSQALTQLIYQGKATIPPVFTKVSTGTKSHTLIIVCSSAKGLCGGLNNNLIRFFERSLIATKGSQNSFIAIGQKSCSYLQEGRHGTIIEHIPEYHFNTLDSIVNTILNHILADPAKYTSVSIFYTHLKNFFLQIPQKQDILPIIEQQPAAENQKKVNYSNYLWEQDPAVLGAALIRQHLYSEIIHTLFHNLISENAARFIAMDQSTNNATKYLEALNLTYNKSRQNIITREISELSSNFD
jgi:F-type H+-transporting ATPase subunit gamma